MLQNVIFRTMIIWDWSSDLTRCYKTLPTLGERTDQIFYEAQHLVLYSFTLKISPSLLYMCSIKSFCCLCINTYLSGSIIFAIFGWSMLSVLGFSPDSQEAVVHTWGVVGVWLPAQFKYRLLILCHGSLAWAYIFRPTLAKLLIARCAQSMGMGLDRRWGKPLPPPV
jgi:hypothetical protein